MTTVEDASKSVNDPQSTLRGAIYKALLAGTATLVVGGVVSAVLEEPVNTKLIPAVLKLVGHHQQIDIFKQTADGKVVLYGCYELLVPPWSRSVSGRMDEITDPKACGVVPGPDSEDPPMQFQTNGSWKGNVMSVAFSHFTDEFGGGAFSADAMSTPGTYIGAMQAQAHDNGQRCMLTHFWVVIGKPEREPRFQKMLEEKIKGTNGQVAMLAQPVAGGRCKSDQKTAYASAAKTAN